MLLIFLSPADFSYEVTCEHAHSLGRAEGGVDVLEEACWGWENFQDEKLDDKEDGQLAASPEFDYV